MLCSSYAFVLVSLLAGYCCYNPLCDLLLVQLPEGKIRGHVLESQDGKDFFAFQEIPYAAPPVGKNRFKDPLPPVPWTDILNATQNKRVCMQNNASALTAVPEDMEISEDCLYINVYTPRVPGTSQELLPVLFWVHAGGYFYGSGALQYYDPKYFMDYDIIVVTMNYRLGPLGFLTTEDNVIPGNLGLKDTVQALKWTYDNINTFGGDKHKITVMGESAGSTTAGFMHLSKRTQGMVAGYILESGTPISPYAYQPNARQYAFKLAKLLDNTFTSEDSNQLLESLLSKTAEEITDTMVSNDGFTANPVGALVIWLPVVEKKGTPNAIITEPMYEILNNGDYNAVPFMTGFTSEESLFFLRYLSSANLQFFKELLDNNTQLVLHPHLNIDPAALPEAAKEYKEIFTSKTFAEDNGAYVRYVTEDVFSTPNIKHAELASHKAVSYVYEFAYKGKMGGFTDNLKYTEGANDVAHTEELHYLFGGREGVRDDIKSYPKEDQLTMKRMLTLWTNFIKYQNPTPTKEEILDNTIWPSLACNGNGKIKYLSINKTLEPRVDPKSYQKANKLLEKYHKPP
uniref:Carboxylic ester hydrolase n=1 Tax=Diabrotica virgifera virgifera TaxID=50390 RepID=A0A6P7GAN7_DIAVI